MQHFVTFVDRDLESLSIISSFTSTVPRGFPLEQLTYVVVSLRKRIAQGISYGRLPNLSSVDVLNDVWDMVRWRNEAWLPSPLKVALPFESALTTHVVVDMFFG